MSWLDPLRARLDGVSLPVTFFFRDDDGGVADAALVALLDVFEQERLPVDVAVIPAALDRATAAELRARFDAAGGLLGLHQHGFAHHNHQRAGRKAEFGTDRPAPLQRADLIRGRERLEVLLGERTDPLFTPPWNRCTPVTGRLLVAEGFRALSRDHTAGPLALPGLEELPVAVDWSRRRRAGGRVGPEDLGWRLARAAEPGGAVGVMLHHALLDEGGLRRLRELLRLLRRHPAARPVPMARRLADRLGRHSPAGAPTWSQGPRR